MPEHKLEPDMPEQKLYLEPIILERKSEPTMPDQKPDLKLTVHEPNLDPESNTKIPSQG